MINSSASVGQQRTNQEKSRPVKSKKNSFRGLLIAGVVSYIIVGCVVVFPIEWMLPILDAPLAPLLCKEPGAELISTSDEWTNSEGETSVSVTRFCVSEAQGVQHLTFMDRLPVRLGQAAVAWLLFVVLVKMRAAGARRRRS